MFIWEASGFNSQQKISLSIYNKAIMSFVQNSNIEFSYVAPIYFLYFFYL